MSIATQPRGGNAKRERERLEFQLCRRWRSQGKLQWTDAELDRAVNDLLQPQPATLPLFDTGEAAKESQRAAFRQACQTASGRRDTVLRLFREAGRSGATRAELAGLIGCQQSDICQVVLELLRSGDLVELTQRRKSQWGGAGIVIVLSEFAEAKHYG